jgi:K+-transporting ATPase c subunit
LISPFSKRASASIIREFSASEIKEKKVNNKIQVSVKKKHFFIITPPNYNIIILNTEYF